MNKELIIEKTKEYVKSRLEGEGSGHDWYHILRVYNNAIDIARNEESVDIFIVKLGALLHDIADHKFGYNDDDRKNIISGFLSKYDVSQEDIKEVVYITNYISFKGGTNNHVMKSIEGKIVQDADRLDAMGAIGISRAFTYGGYINRPMYDVNPNNIEHEKGDGYINTDTITHFYEKLLLLKDRMNTNTGRKKAIIRHKTMEMFLDMFFKEWNGEI
ncbi:protein containing HD domain [Clostridium botulinum C str. Eklund]|nr:protein containing HD domain [Clostridium botulinum C str. Eklund]